MKTLTCPECHTAFELHKYESKPQNLSCPYCDGTGDFKKGEPYSSNEIFMSCQYCYGTGKIDRRQLKDRRNKTLERRVKILEEIIRGPWPHPELQGVSDPREEEDVP